MCFPYPKLSILPLKLTFYSILYSQHQHIYRIVENFGGGKLWRMGKTTNWRKNLGKLSEIVCRQVKLWQFLGDRVGSMQANKLHTFIITLTASRKLACT